MITAKGYQGQVASYAKGGPVVGKTSQFFKTPDRFRDSKAVKKTEDVFPKTKNTFGKSKSDC